MTGPSAVRFLRWCCRVVMVLMGLHGSAGNAEAQTDLVRVARGNSAVVTLGSTLERVSIADPSIADVLPVSATEVVVNGISPGTTTLLVWGLDGSRTQYQIRVTPDVAELQEELARLFPGQDVQARAVGTSIVLSGQVRDPQVAARALSLATSLADNALVVDQIAVPDRPQVLLQVRIAEVNQNAVRNLGSSFLWADPATGDAAGVNPGGLPSLGGTPEAPIQSLSDQVTFFLLHRDSNVSALIRALQQEGQFRSLAEPNLIAIPGETATFLAGGEFPYPVIQGQSQAISIQFREFGVRLEFTPEITNSGAIRLQVAPEVSSLDFANGLTLAGFQIPTVLSRRAETVVELREGETFAIAGLMDNNTTRNISKVPLLGDIPILGALFRSEDIRQNRSELLVLVTPHLIRASAEPPPLPAGEPGEWNWFRSMRPDPAPPPPGSGSDPGVR